MKFIIQEHSMKGKDKIFISLVVFLLLTNIVTYLFYHYQLGLFKKRYNSDLNSLKNGINSLRENPIGKNEGTPSADFQDELGIELLGENNVYTVYLLKQNDNLAREGELVIKNNDTSHWIKVEGTFSIFGSTIVMSSDDNQYILLSNGTSSSRTVIPISFVEKEQLVDEFNSCGNLLFWNNYLIYGNCDYFQNRPWEGGIASSIISLNLENGESTVLFNSDLYKHYLIEEIVGDILQYQVVSVNKETDWGDEDSQRKESKYYNFK